mmetsp:Transcript_107198/g.303156  ORF Transcript_107198/g.303156 Transcript_107198/m.303156 type:complete len:428 (-) Transcript_107198:45-1328(-)|eukprot:CAMPEP_0168436882 /NCGR_PEP_ID=MMETSP0228-20121227/41151_1 /TAXON_ID=133427 /ORGANISM="Protoceratium reticulatum, Strain CCCM 535 (=CCMP 1889)" /LENGTH=427 /DNA_ID=CAMNT_0008451085 /DNA_START=41 /DNA_END=1324 /DNA_ORIENTATION=-
MAASITRSTTTCGFECLGRRGANKSNKEARTPKITSIELLGSKEPKAKSVSNEGSDGSSDDPQSPWRGWSFSSSLNLGSKEKPLEPSWVLGVYTGVSVRWLSFSSEKEALEAFRSSWSSRVLFSPLGTPVRCMTRHLDQKGVGVARVLKAHKGHDPDTGWCPHYAMESGEVPFIPPERPPLVPQAMQMIWQMVATRENVSWWCSEESVCYFDVAKFPGVKGHVALTIDDVPCRLGRGNSMVQDVSSLLREYGAKATFMVMGRFVDGSEADLAGLLRAGHELGNHGLVDKRYDLDSAEDFARAVDECSERLAAIHREAGAPEELRWFRAPHGKFSREMAEVIGQRGLHNVMCDTYACCPIIQDGVFIGDFLARNAQDGSIIVIHMPEHGFREWCMTGLRRLLSGLARRGLSATTVGALAARAGWVPGA